MASERVYYHGEEDHDAFHIGVVCGETSYCRVPVGTVNRRILRKSAGLSIACPQGFSFRPVYDEWKKDIALVGDSIVFGIRAEPGVLPGDYTLELFPVHTGKDGALKVESSPVSVLIVHVREPEIPLRPAAQKQKALHGCRAHAADQN
jgi:hypothetical protein